MEPAILVVLLAPLVPIAVALAVTRRSKKARALSAMRAAASKFRLAFDESAFEIRGETRGIGVAVSAASGATVVVLDGRGAIPRDVALVPRGAAGEGIPTGDAAFDAAVSAAGDPARVLALLDARARRLLASSAAIHGTRVEDGRLTLRVPWLLEDPVSLVELLQRAIDLARSLAADPVPARLAAAAARDPDPRVRGRIVSFLASQAGDRDAFAPVIDSALLGDDEGVRCAALGGLGDGAVAWLERILETGAFESGALERRVIALRRLGEAAPPETVARLVERHLASESAELRREAIAVAGRRRVGSAVPRLRVLVANEDAGDAAAAATALGEIGDPAAEPDLVAALARFEAVVKRAAAGALAKTGTVAAVEALLRASEGLFVDAEVKRLSRLAVRAIQERIGAVDEGRLSIAEGAEESGRLGLSAGGELAKPEEKGSGT